MFDKNLNAALGIAIISNMVGNLIFLIFVLQRTTI